MSQNNKLLRKAIFIIITLVISCVFCSGEAQAKTSTAVQEGIVRKIIYQGIYNCYDKGMVKQEVKLKNYLGASSLMSSSLSSYAEDVVLVTGLNTSSIWSSGKSPVFSKAYVSCSDFFDDGGGSQSVIRFAGKTPPDPAAGSEVKQFFVGMGYDVVESSSTSCYRLKYSVDGKAEQETNDVCYDAANGLTDNLKTTANVNIPYLIGRKDKLCLKYGIGFEKCTSFGGGSFSGNVLMDLLKTICGAAKNNRPFCYEKLTFTNAVESNSIRDSVAVINDRPKAAFKAIKYLFDKDYSNTKQIELSRVETRLLYQDYLESYYGMPISCEEGVTGEKIHFFMWFDKQSMSMKKCHYNEDNKGKAKHINEHANGVKSVSKGVVNGWMTRLSIGGLDELLRVFENDDLGSDYSEAEMGALKEAASGETFQNTQEGTGGKDNPCESQAKGLGWILCTMLNLMAESSNELYNKYVGPALAVKASVFTDERTRGAWEGFRNIANIVFIILFLIVIISQLTGLGIDNYGIKRLLPKLIITAILVNISYFLCELAIDASNTFGYGLQSLLDHSIDVPQQIVGGEIAIQPSGLISVGILAGAFASGWVVVTNPAILLSLLVSALGLLISMFFLFVLLSVRQAAVVVLAVAAPVAIVCSLLPNTKRVFDIWKKAFTALLLLYPICGMLVGGGNFVSKLLLMADNSFFMAFTAMAVGVAPIFFIPSLVKSSMSALGNVGATISGLGNKVRGGVERGARNSGVYKNLQERGLERRARIMGGINPDGSVAQMGRFRRFLRGGDRNIARNRAAYLKSSGARANEEGLMNGGFEEAMSLQEYKERVASFDRQYGNMTLGNMMDQFNHARDEGNETDISVWASVINQRYGARGVNKIAQSLGEVHAGDASYRPMVNALRRTMNENSSFAGNLSKTGDAYDMVSNGGIGYNDDAEHDLSYFTQNMQSGTITSVGDWATQTTATLTRAVGAGSLTYEMMSDLLNSDDPAVQSKLQGDPAKRDVLQAALYHQQNGTSFNEQTVAADASQYRADQKAREAAASAAQTAQQAAGTAHQTFSSSSQ